MWADAQRDGRPAEYRWRPLRQFRNSIAWPGLTPRTYTTGPFLLSISVFVFSFFIILFFVWFRAAD